MVDGETRHFIDREAANAYVRELRLLGWEEVENVENEHGGRQVVYTGTRQRAGLLMIVILLVTIIGFIIYVLTRSNRPARVTVIYRPEGDPLRTPEFVARAERDAKAPDVRKALQQR